MASNAGSQVSNPANGKDEILNKWKIKKYFGGHINVQACKLIFFALGLIVMMFNIYNVRSDEKADIKIHLCNHSSVFIMSQISL